MSPACIDAGVTPGGQFPNNIIPAACQSAAGQALLNYYPASNITPTGAQNNYQTVTTGTSHTQQVSARYNRSFGQAPTRGGGRGFGGRGGGGQQNRNAPKVLRQSFAESFAYSHSASASQNFVPQLGGRSSIEGYSLASSYTISYGRLTSTATLNWNRSHTLAANYFTNGAINPAQTLQGNDGTMSALNVGGNPVIYGNPFYFGVPSVSLTQFSGLSDTTPSESVNQTISFTDFVAYRHGKHNLRVGGDIRRIHADSIGGTNALGSFTFSGFATESAADQNSANPTSGSAIADLLLGLPQQTGVTAGLNKIYLRANVLDWYVQDDYRVKANVTINAGLRWEYFSPYVEKYNRLTNLAHNADFSQISEVCATAATSCTVGSPRSLVNPDRVMFAPRISIAWSPKFKFTKQTVVRAGYGINYNTGQYAAFAQNLAFQQPFSVTQTNTLTTATSPTTCYLPSQAPPGTNPMTLTNGFGCSTQATQSNYGVNPNYRLGRVQVFSLNIQRSLPRGVVVNIGYNGALSGDLDMLRAPNRTASGVLNPNANQFTYEDSLGFQRSNALAISAQKRLEKGISLQAFYTYSHSIDNASSIGGSGSSIAQNDQNLQAEESNSTFDVRHKLSGSWILELPFGPNRAFLNKGGVWSKIMDGYSVSGNYTFATGTYATPVYSGTPQEIAAGARNSLRPDLVAGQPILGSGTLKNWVNKDAFVPPGEGTYGNASRNSIELPGTVSVNGSLSRTVQLGDTRSFEGRVNVSNVFNTVQYAGVFTTVNSANFGQVSSAANMRQFSFVARFRF